MGARQAFRPRLTEPMARRGASAERSRFRVRALARHEMRDRFDVVLVQRIGDLQHDDAAVPAARAVLIIVQRFYDRFLTLPSQSRNFALTGKRRGDIAGNGDP